MGRPLFLLCCFAFGLNLYAESAFINDPGGHMPAAEPAGSAFALELRRDIIMSTLALGMFLGAYLIEYTSSIQSRDVNDVNFIDRQLMFPYRSDIVRNILGPVIVVLPIMVPLSLVEWNLRNDFGIWFTYGIMYAQAAGFAYGARRAIGGLVGRHRPFHYLGCYDEPVRALSFPSGSTAMAFMSATFLSTTFSTEFSDSLWRIPIIAGSHMLAATLGGSRIMTGHHFLTDVLAGAAIGSFFGWLIPTLHRRPALHIANGENKFSFRFTGNGAIMSVEL